MLHFILPFAPFARISYGNTPKAILRTGAFSLNTTAKLFTLCPAQPDA